MGHKYSIVFHFDNTSITSLFETEAKRDEEYDNLYTWLVKDIQYYDIGETIVNLDKVICITKGEDEWKSAKSH